MQDIGQTLFILSLVAMPPIAIANGTRITGKVIAGLLLYVCVGCWATMPASHPVYLWLLKQHPLLIPGSCLGFAIGSWLTHRSQRHLAA